jgi:hypothetical protein
MYISNLDLFDELTLLSLYNIILPFVSGFDLKHVCLIIDCQPALFWILFEWNILFYPFTFNLYVSLDLKWVLEHSCWINFFYWVFLIIAFFIGKFNSFIFKVVTNEEEFSTAILLLFNIQLTYFVPYSFLTALFCV